LFSTQAYLIVIISKIATRISSINESGMSFTGFRYLTSIKT